MSLFCYLRDMETFVTYIEELMYLHDQVIVPGFGMLVTRHESAAVRKGVLLPPSKSVVFNPYAWHDDGMLVGWVAQRENIDARKARARVTRFRDALVERLQRGETVALGSIGVFALGRGRRVTLESPEFHLATDATGMSPVVLSRRETGELRVGSRLMTRVFGYGISAAIIAGIITISQSDIFLPARHVESATMQPAPRERVVTGSPVIVSPRHDFVDYTPVP